LPVSEGVVSWNQEVNRTFNWQRRKRLKGEMYEK